MATILHAGRRTDLELGRITDTHWVRLAKCLEAVIAWCGLRRAPIEQAWQQPDVMDGLLAHSVQFYADSGYALYRAKRTILGVQMALRSYRGKLRRSWDGIFSWQARLPFRTVSPFLGLCWTPCVWVWPGRPVLRLTAATGIGWQQFFFALVYGASAGRESC